MKKCRFVAIILCVVLLLAIASCKTDSSTQSPNSSASGDQTPSGSQGSSGNQSPGGSQNTNENAPSSGSSVSGRNTLTIGTSGDTGTLDPVGMSGSFLSLSNTYMDPILTHDGNMNVVWVLATGIDEVTPTQWTIHVREGVTFSNGNPLTADDILFSFILARDTPQRALNVQSLDLDNSSVVDPYTLDIRLTDYNVAQMTMLSAVMIVDAESYDPVDFSLNPVGTGPYEVTEYVVNSHTHMKARDGYWGERPTIENLVFKVINEDAQKVNAIETGTVDWISVPAQDVEYVKSLPNFNLVSNRTGMAIQVLFSVDPTSAFFDVEARYAACHAIDRQAIINLVYNGYASIVDYPASMATLDYEPRLANLHETYSIGHDIELAKQYAVSSGLVDKEVRIMTNGGPEYVTMAEIIQTNLKDIGVKAVILNYDQATLRSLYRSDGTEFDICLYFVSAPTWLASDIVWANVRFSTILMAGNWPGFERFTELGGQVLSNPDAKARSDIFFEMIKIFDNAALWYGVCETQSFIAYSKDLNDVVFNAFGGVRFQDLSFS